MQTHLYTDGGRAVKRHPSRTYPQKRRRLAGTRHKRGWRPHALALRAHLKSLFPVAPNDTGSAERSMLETIDFAESLDPKARYLLRFALAELVKLSNQR
jgi:hypothetical protein